MARKIIDGHLHGEDIISCWFMRYNREMPELTTEKVIKCGRRGSIKQRMHIFNGFLIFLNSLLSKEAK